MIAGTGRSFTGGDTGGYSVIGKIGRELKRGCYRLVIYGTEPRQLAGSEEFFLRREEQMVRLRVKDLVIRAKNSTCCFHQGDISAVGGALIGREVYMSDALRAVVANGEYYVNDLIGCLVYSDNGRQLGSLCEVLRTGANDVYVVKDDGGKELLLPAVNDIILKVDIPKKKVIVHLVEGL